MVVGNNWHISYCAGYVVPQCKHLDSSATLEQIQGSSVQLRPEVHRYFLPKFVDSSESCTVQIGFTHTDGEQRNEIRDLIRSLAFGSEEAKHKTSRELAVRLGQATDKRSLVGLFIVLTGNLGEEARVVLFKFPADESLQATFEEEGLSINVIEGAFSRKSDFFKAAFFQDNNANTTFWKGKVEDKQANQRGSEVSNLWVMQFLQALPELTPARGSRLLAKALRTTVSKSKSPTIQHELVAAAITVKSQRDRNFTLRDFADNYLPAEVRDSFLTEIGSPILADAPFVIDTQILDEQLAVKTIILDTQFSVTGFLDEYQNNNNFTQLEDDDGISEIILRGRVIREQLGTTKKLPRG